ATRPPRGAPAGDRPALQRSSRGYGVGKMHSGATQRPYSPLRHCGVHFRPAHHQVACPERRIARRPRPLGGPVRPTDPPARRPRPPDGPVRPTAPPARRPRPLGGPGRPTARLLGGPGRPTARLLGGPGRPTDPPARRSPDRGGGRR